MGDRNALITGGTRGIGAGIAVALKKKGYKVAVTYHGHEEKALAFQEAYGIEAFKWDVGDYEECRQGLGRVREALGEIDILVNNAGVTRDAMFHKSHPEDWRYVINTNLLSCFNMSHLVIEGMRQRNFGRIVNISSINAQRGQIGQTGYCAAKAGILGFTKALALECASKGITVNAVCPGYINTEMVQAVPSEALNKIIQQIPVGRLGKIDEIAQAVVFFVSEEAAFITGSTLSVNGGHYLI
jgi:acetoacetyl-CoA reductase